VRGLLGLVQERNNTVLSPLSEIAKIIEKHAPYRLTLSDRVFGKDFDQSCPVAIYGAGIIGGELSQSLLHEGIRINLFLDSNPSKSGREINGIPIKHIEEMRSLSGHNIVIATKGGGEEIEAMLQKIGLNKKNTITKINHASDLAAYIAEPAFLMRDGLNRMGKAHLSEKLHTDQNEVNAAYAILGDEKSRKILTTKLACLNDPSNIELLGSFVKTFSEPIKKWGDLPISGIFPESHCYFQNDLFTITDGAVLIDVGAYDGCSTDAFIKKCQENGIKNYKSLAFEPDPSNFKACASRFADNEHVECHNNALHTHETMLRFVSSAHCSLKSSSHIDPNGDITIKALALDSFGMPQASIIKADPPGLDIAINVLKGAHETIARCNPILIFPAYHSIDAIYKMPNAINRLFPGQYTIYLRHLSWSIGETSVFALPKV
jgi:FkbM family methyltransferase